MDIILLEQVILKAKYIYKGKVRRIVRQISKELVFIIKKHKQL